MQLQRASGINQFCRKSVLSNELATYTLYNLFLEQNLYGYFSYRKDVDGAFNPNYNQIIPDPTEKPYAYRFDPNTGEILECGQVLKRIIKKQLVREFVDPLGTFDDKFIIYKANWEAEQRIHFNLGPNDPLPVTFDPLTFFDGFVYFDLSGRFQYYFEYRQTDGDIFDILPQTLILQTYLSYDADILEFNKPPTIADLFTNTPHIPNANLLNSGLSHTCRYDKLMLLKDPIESLTNNIATRQTYFPQDIKWKYPKDILNHNILETPILKCNPLMIAFQTAVSRDSFQRDVEMFVISFISP